MDAWMWRKYDATKKWVCKTIHGRETEINTRLRAE